ncbi:MAG: BON domain-containing protein [Acidobacteria bacterium]|nr:BON domain-containing protein [Acidobacteriota bacterium]
MRSWAVSLVLCLILFQAGAVWAQGNPGDDRIYDQVRLKLTNHPDVKGGAIEVTVKEGVVTLAGKVRTEKARQKAEGLAGKVKGVKKVINHLQVSPT